MTIAEDPVARRVRESVAAFYDAIDRFGLPALTPGLPISLTASYAGIRRRRARACEVHRRRRAARGPVDVSRPDDGGSPSQSVAPARGAALGRGTYALIIHTRTSRVGRPGAQATGPQE